MIKNKCNACVGTGEDFNEGDPCLECGGTGDADNKKPVKSFSDYTNEYVHRQMLEFYKAYYKK